MESDTPENIRKAIDIVKAEGKIPGLSVKPKTPASALWPFIDGLGLVLVMEELKRVTVESLNTCDAKHIRDFSSIKSCVKSNISGYLYKVTKCSPMFFSLLSVYTPPY